MTQVKRGIFKKLSLAYIGIIFIPVLFLVIYETRETMNSLEEKLKNNRLIQAEIEDAGFHIIRDLTGHGLWKTLHEKPYMYNYGKPGEWTRLKKWMLLAIEPIIGETSGQIKDSWDWEIYVKDGSLGCQYEHTILITDGDAEIIV